MTPESPRETSGVVVPSPRSAPRKWKRVFEAGLPLLILLAMAAIDFPLCPTRLFFGVPCPGCGLTRATLALLQLDFAAMWRFHPLAPLMTPIVGWMLTKPVLEELGWIPKHRVFVRVPQWVWATLVVLFLGLYVARLFGALGGMPDPIDPSEGLVGRAWHATHAH